MFTFAKAACAATLLTFGASAFAQGAYPARPVKIVIPLGPGNSVEIATRLIADKLSAALGQPFVIEAQPGAAGQIGTERVAHSPADGYTLLAANDGIMTMLPNLQQVRFDPVRDFAPIVRTVGIPFVLIAHPSVEASSAKALIELAKAQPGKLEFSSGGVGSAQQLAMELFMAITATKFVHVPYKGAPQAAMDVVSGQIPVAMAGLPIVASFIKQGRLRGLGIASEKRLPLVPEVTTLAEQGIPLRFATWAGLFAPAGTATEIIQRVNDEALDALRAPDVQAKLSELGFETYGGSPEQFSEVVKHDLGEMSRLIKQAGIKQR